MRSHFTQSRQLSVFSDTPAPLHAKDALEITCVLISRHLVTQVCSLTHRRRFTRVRDNMRSHFTQSRYSSVSLSHTHVLGPFHARSRHPSVPLRHTHTGAASCEGHLLRHRTTQAHPPVLRQFKISSDFLWQTPNTNNRIISMSFSVYRATYLTPLATHLTPSSDLLLAAHNESVQC